MSNAHNREVMGYIDRETYPIFLDKSEEAC